jgi:hypothetical protein
MKRSLILFTSFIILTSDLFTQPVTVLLHNNWKAKNATGILLDGTELTGSGFNTAGWLDSVVPGKVLTTLLHNNQIPDPFFGMNNNLIPDVFDTGRDLSLIHISEPTRPY